MVRKLLKYEAIYYARTLLPAEGILLGIGVLNRFVQLFESDTLVYDILFGSSLTILLLGCVACLLFAVAIGVIRFYRNMYTAEGYLTFTLPATERQHLTAKLIAAVLASVSAFLAVAVSLCIAAAGDLLTEIGKAVVYLCDLAETYVGGHLYGYLALLLLMMLLATVSGYLLYFACLSVGQLSRKNRILASVGVYFGYEVAMQILGSIRSVVFSLAMTGLFADTDWTEAIARFAEAHLVGVLYGAFGILLLGQLIWCAVLFAIVYGITRKRLNLE